MNIKDFENKIINADCLDILTQLPDKCVDLVLTDPPYIYNEKNCGTGKWTNSRKMLKEVFTRHGSTKSLDKGFNKEILEQIKRICKKFNAVFFCSQYQLEDYLKFARDNDYRFTVMVWQKLDPMPLTNNKYLDDLEYIIFIKEDGVKMYGNYKTLSRVYSSYINKEDKKKYNHPTIKPLNLIEKFVINHSKEGDIIIDPFSGSGTTAVACYNQKRNFICIEKDLDYWKTSYKRLEEHKRQLTLF